MFQSAGNISALVYAVFYALHYSRIVKEDASIFCTRLVNFFVVKCRILLMALLWYYVFASAVTRRFYSANVTLVNWLCCRISGWRGYLRDWSVNVCCMSVCIAVQIFDCTLTVHLLMGIKLFISNYGFSLFLFASAPFCSFTG